MGDQARQAADDIKDGTPPGQYLKNVAQDARNGPHGLKGQVVVPDLDADRL